MINRFSRRITALVLCLLLVFSAFPTALAVDVETKASAGTIAISASKTTVKRGDEVTFTVSFSGGLKASNAH